MKITRMLSLIIAVMALLAAMVPAMIQADTVVPDTLTGKFKINSKPVITSVTASDMTPQTETTVNVSVSNVEGKAELKTLVLKVWYDANGGTPSDTEYGNVTTGNAQTAIIITWTQALVPNPATDFVLTEGASSTWSLGTCVEPANLGSVFQFVFTPGKVATETTASAVWQVAAQATDDGPPSRSSVLTGTNWYDNTPPLMSFYGPVTVAAGDADFGTLSPEADFGPDTDVTVPSTVWLANGNYDEKVKSSATWDDGGSNTATLASDGVTDVGQEFALKADDTATMPIGVNGLVDSVNGVTIDDQGTQTVEAGDTPVTTNTLWLKLASGFEVAEYSGTVTYMIANGS